MNEKPYINPPKNCDICKNKIIDKFFDGRTLDGIWANMCFNCYFDFGHGPDYVNSYKKIEGEFYNTKELKDECFDTK